MDLCAQAAPELRRLQRLLETSRLLNSTLELSELTEIVLRILKDGLPIERCTLFILDRRQKKLRSLIAQELGEVEIVVAMGQGLAGHVAMTGEILDIKDVYADPRFDSAFDTSLNFRTRDALCIPIFDREQSLVGVLQMLNRQREFDLADREFLEDICTYIGVALHNAWLYQQLKERKTVEHDLGTFPDDGPVQPENHTPARKTLGGIVHEIEDPTLAVGQGALCVETEQLASQVVPDVPSQTGELVRNLEAWYATDFERRIVEMSNLLQTEIAEGMREQFTLELQSRLDAAQSRYEESMNQWESNRIAMREEIANLRTQKTVSGVVEEIASVQERLREKEHALKKMMSEEAFAYSRILQTKAECQTLESYLRGLKFHVAEVSANPVGSSGAER
jgi:putative methionine-R-sulfoxide reductase with GAF domain